MFASNYLAGASASRYPSGTLVAGLFQDQFVDAAAGDYTVRAGSILEGAAPDGTDIGVDYPELVLSLAGVQEGRPALIGSQSPDRSRRGVHGSVHLSELHPDRRVTSGNGGNRFAHLGFR